jgi:hypothetical protein
MTAAADITQEWAEWVSQSGQRYYDLAADDLAGDLLDQFRRCPTPAMLADIIVGDWYVEVTSRVVRAEDADAEAAKLRSQGRTARIDPAEDFAPGVSRARVVLMRRRQNLYELCQQRSIHRRSIVASLEAVCRSLMPGDPRAGLALGRSIFQPALMTGCAPKIPVATSIAPVPAALGSDIPPAPPPSLSADRRAKLNRLAEQAREGMADALPTLR